MKKSFGNQRTDYTGNIHGGQLTGNSNTTGDGNHGLHGNIGGARHRTPHK